MGRVVFGMSHLEGDKIISTPVSVLILPFKSWVLFGRCQLILRLIYANDLFMIISRFILTSPFFVNTLTICL
jgi:hypothetical protein